MAREPAGTAGDRGKECPVRAAVASVCRTTDRHTATTTTAGTSIVAVSIRRRSRRDTGTAKTLASVSMRPRVELCSVIAIAQPQDRASAAHLTHAIARTSLMLRLPRHEDRAIARILTNSPPTGSFLPGAPFFASTRDVRRPIAFGSAAARGGGQRAIRGVRQDAAHHPPEHITGCRIPRIARGLGKGPTNLPALACRRSTLRR